MREFVNSSRNIQARKINPWVQIMADNLNYEIRKATDVYQNHPEEYYQMVLNGFKKAGQFSWETSAQKYYEVYKMTGRI